MDFAVQSPRPRIQLEICIASVADALAAQDGGADRLELNTALALGGLTPSLGLLKEVRDASNLPLITMIRPRPGGFCYSRHEFAVMQRDVDLALANGADGVAFGILREDGTLDLDRCSIVVEQAGMRETVMHRAFDFVPDSLFALEQLAQIGVTRVLTSGRRETALDGATEIKRCLKHAGGALEILPAGKINASCVAELLHQTGCRQVHAALKMPAAELPIATADMGVYEMTNPVAVRELRAALNAWQAAQPE